MLSVPDLVRGGAPIGYIPPTYYKYKNEENCPYDSSEVKDTQYSFGKKVETSRLKEDEHYDYKDFINIDPNNNYDNITKVLSGTNADRK